MSLAQQNSTTNYKGKLERLYYATGSKDSSPASPGHSTFPSVEVHAPDLKQALSRV
jgi:hypothetical protein